MRSKNKSIQKFIAAIFALIAVGVNLQIFAQTDQTKRNEIFEQVWNTINEKYYDVNFNDVDWKAVRVKYRARLEKVSGDNEFYALLDRMAGELRDSHTRVYSPSQRDERKEQKRTSVGIGIKEIENVVIISSVAPDSEAERRGITTGMIVRSINGQPVKKAIRKAKQSVGVSSSERSTAMRVYSKLLAGEPETFSENRSVK